ncbi:peptidoglycan-binding protein [Streptomyces sp. NPDC059142]|uniref:peptidoglycan-binding domain-containing protein n=1 Tax=Streptomyces sp. NPDC059142 TaxID=3346739 RepID=UPI0036AD6CCA
MRALTKALVGATVAIGIAAGGLATAGTAMAAPAPTERPTATGEIGTLAVVNLGLSTRQAKNVQCWLERWDYRGANDGLLGTGSWKAFQYYLEVARGYDGDRDGVVGPKTIQALQRLLTSAWGYRGKIDGIAGDQTKAAFKRFANDQAVYCS